MPINTTYTRSFGGLNPPHTVVRSQSGVKRRPQRPYIVLPYSASGGKLEDKSQWGRNPPADYFISPQEWNALNAIHGRQSSTLVDISPAIGAHQRAYDRFLNQQDEVGRAEIGAFIAEINDSFEMVYRRVMQLVNAYRHLRRGNIGGAARALRVRPPETRTRWTRPRDASSLWLELWFGWLPAIQDIWGALQILEYHFQDRPISGSASATIPFRKVDRTSINWVWNGSFKTSIKMGAKRRITNPNLYLLSQLGLTNPAGVVWEVIPFSFLVDWFLNVGDVIRNTSSDIGVQYVDAYTTTFTRTTSMEHSREWVDGRGGRRVRNHLYAVTRDPALVKPTPWVYFGSIHLSQTRAATAISLLVQLFTRG